MSSEEKACFISQARTATAGPIAYACGYASGATVVIDVTAVGVTPSVVPAIECFDARSGKWYALLTGAAITAVGTVVLQVFPGATDVAGLSANATLTEQVRVSMTHGNAVTITYSVAIHLFT